jgi:hypothetical protein
MPNKLKALCEIEWSAVGVGWPPEGSVDKNVVNEVYRVIVGRPEHPDQFPYIDCWQNAVLSWPTWLRPCLEEACRIMVASMATTSKCREKTKELILVREPKEAPSSALLPPTLDGETQVKIIP